MLFGIGESSKQAAVSIAAADLDAHLLGPPTAGPLSVIKIDTLDYWSREVIVVEQVTTFTGPVAGFTFLVIPINSIILSVQANLETDITAISPAVKIGVGVPSALIKYGQINNLTKNSKLDTLYNTYFVLTAQEPMFFVALRSNNNTGGTIGNAGEKIRTRILYLALLSLPNAP